MWWFIVLAFAVGILVWQWAQVMEELRDDRLTRQIQALLEEDTDG